MLSEKSQYERNSDGFPVPPDEETNDSIKMESIRVFISHRTPCRNWCPCACHAKRKLKMTVPGIMESLLGKMFVGYAGFPVINKLCDFRGCRD